MGGLQRAAGMIAGIARRGDAFVLNEMVLVLSEMVLVLETTRSTE